MGKIVLFAILWALLCTVVEVFAIMLIWNFIGAGLLGFNTIGFWAAAGILLVVNIAGWIWNGIKGNS